MQCYPGTVCDATAPMTIGVLLLAAGKSRRYGSDKRLAQMTGGRGLLDATLDNIIESDLPLIVCTGTDDTDLATRVSNRHIPCIRCPNSSSGMGSTLADGVATVPNSWTGLVIALGDMPLIRPQTYRTVANALEPDNIVTPTHGEQRGHPVGFGRSYFSELTSLCGDTGARQLLASHRAAIVPVDVRDPGILIDVDTPQQMAAIAN